ncbi:uncharacterized protein LOC133921226 isoform X2 [Phragmites australis]|uniref:uncharacterized protein LOC133921226 isoform X2 n=1 Tax=Phragmites australis TaxID=29695 RepID=UPI002D775B1D|nr:uncharacterized protein LOC133921226 isoform X2 [Phragmites australis]
MLQLQKHLIPFHRSASPIHLSLHRALLSAAAAASPAHFAVDDYLVTTCGLTNEQAAKAAKYISHFKFPSKADAVLAFFTGPALGLSKADIALLVSLDPRILNSSVEKTLRARVDGFLSHGFTAAQIRSFVRRAPSLFRSVNINKKLGFWMPLFGSPERLLQASDWNNWLLTTDLKKVEPNVAFLKQCGLSAGDIAKLLVAASRLVTMHPEYVQDAVRRTTQLGVAPGSQMFRHALATIGCICQEKVDAKVAVLKETLGWSQEEVNLAFSKAPRILVASEERLRRNAEFLINKVGLPPQYIAHRSVLLMYSLERRLVPRHLVVKALKERRLVDQDRCFFNVVTPTEEKFLEKFVAPYEKSIPGLADDYESACAGKVPEGFQY